MDAVSAGQKAGSPALKEEVSSVDRSVTRSSFSSIMTEHTASTSLLRVKRLGGLYSDQQRGRRKPLHALWASLLPTVSATFVGLMLLAAIIFSFLNRQLDDKGCGMSYMRPVFQRYDDFDTEYTRFASKYSLYLYREGGIDEDFRVKGVPALFIPGNAGSYKQVRSLAAEAAYHYQNSARFEPDAGQRGKLPLDVFSVDFNEDITAFHGQTLLDQAEYLNDAISFILSLYHTPSQSLRNPDLPDPGAVIIIGHSMGGVVARTMPTMPNYQANSINTMITLSAPHARPPVSFDGDIVRIYKGVNQYWRQSYAQEREVDNSLREMTLVSIAGGGLDTIVSSDYANVASLIPESHGFTVFTSSIPQVWTGADHLAITWCDQGRKSVIHALYDIVDATKSTQTLSRDERMRKFKKRFLTGLESVVEKALPHQQERTILTLEKGRFSVVHGHRLVLQGSKRADGQPNIHLLPIPAMANSKSKRFTMLTNAVMDIAGGQSTVNVLICETLPLSHSHESDTFTESESISFGNPLEIEKLACKTVTSDVVTLPQSTSRSTYPFETGLQPYSYLQYGMSDLLPAQFIAVIDKSTEHDHTWVVAEFADVEESFHRVDQPLITSLTKGLHHNLNSPRPLVFEIQLPSIRTSLLTYQLHVGKKDCTESLFAPLVRQHIGGVHESKFFVNIKDVNVNLHGVAPYIPPPFFAHGGSDGLKLQFWLEPTCDGDVEISLHFDLLGSLGKLWMRYRIVFAAFPIFLVALVLRQQFRIYDDMGSFKSFSVALNDCILTSFPIALAALTFMSISMTDTRPFTFPRVFGDVPGSWIILFKRIDHELLLGSDDAFFWFLIPLFGLICTAICVIVNYLTLTIIITLAFIYNILPTVWRKENHSAGGFAVTSTSQRAFTALILLSLISTVIPYHFAYMVLCLVQIATCVRSYNLAKASQLESDYNFYHYTHSILILMMWILPINIPVLVVWIRNLAVNWLTPFSSHHNLLSILPFILVVETLSTGRMVPRLQSRFRIGTNLLLFSFAAYAALYGVSYAYVLHHLANIFCAWLLVLHLDLSSMSHQRVSSIIETIVPGDEKKRP